MSTIINGTSEPVRQPDGFRFDPVRGWQTTIRFLGASKAKMLAKANEFTSTGCTVDIYCENAVGWWLTAVSPTALDGSTEAPVNVWESSISFGNKDLENNPNFSSVGETTLGIINNWLKNPPTDGAEPTPALTGAALVLLRLKKRGTAHTVYQPILRHTQIVSSLYNVQTAYTNIGRIYTDPGAPSDFLLGLPASGASSRSNIVSGDDTTGFVFGWLKKPPTASTAAYNKRQIEQIWEFGEYNKFQFGALV